MNRKRNIRIVIVIEFITALLLQVVSTFLNHGAEKDLLREIALGILLGICIQLIIFRLKPGLYADRKQAEDYNG